MQPPPEAGGPSVQEMMTWTSRVWFARSPSGLQTREASSLSQMSRAFRQGVLSPDIEVAIEGTWVWENVRLVLARYASLAPPNAHDLRESGRDAEGFPELELTLTGHIDQTSEHEQSNDLTVPAPGPPVPARIPMPTPLRPPPLPPLPQLPLPPPVPSLDERSRRAVAPTPPTGPRLMPPNDGSLWSLDVAIPPRLPNLVFLLSAALAVLVLLIGVSLAIQACGDRLAVAVDARTTLIAVLDGLAWLLGGAVVALAIVVLGRAAAGILLVAQRMDDETRRH